MKMNYYIGFDIGGSSIKAALVENKKIIKSLVYDLPHDLDGLLSLIVKMQKELTKDVAQGNIGGIGFSIAGQLDVGREKILNSPNIVFLNGQPIKNLLAEKVKPYEVRIEHDVHCFLLAEKIGGAVKDLKNIFYLTLGTGIGGAWLVDGKIFFGVRGTAGEVGHMVIDVENGRGEDLEDLASNKFIIKRLGIGSVEALEKARNNDQKAKSVLEELGKNLGLGIANIINIFDPEAVILSGGIAEAKEFILPGIKEAVEKYVVSPAAKETKILFSELGRFGGALGAALMFQ